MCFTFSMSSLADCMESEDCFIGLPHQKNVSKFFTNFDIPHVVCLHVNNSQFLVNSVILALNSSVFERLILSGKDKITLQEMEEDQADGVEEAVRNCLFYLHGRSIKLEPSNVQHIYKFARAYQIFSLVQDCFRFIVSSFDSVQYQRGFSDFIKQNPHSFCQLFFSECIEASNEVEENLPLQASSMPTTKIENNFLQLVQRDDFDLRILFDFEFEKMSYNTLFPNPSDFKQFVRCLTKVVREPMDAVKIASMMSQYGDTAKEPLLDKEPSADNPSPVIPTLVSATTAKKTSKTTFNVNLTNDPLKQIKQSKSTSSVSSETSEHRASSPSRLLTDQKSGKVKNPSLVLGSRKWLGLSVHHVMNCVADIFKQKTGDNHLTIDLIMSWAHLRKFSLNKVHRLFLGCFDNTLISREFLLDVKETICKNTASGKTFKIKNSKDCFFVSETFTSEVLIAIIKGNGILSISNPSEKCEVKGCIIKDHKIQIGVKLNKSAYEIRSNQLFSLLYQSEISHKDNIVHYYLLALDVDFYIDQLFSLRVLGKDELLKLIKPYSHFTLKVLFLKSGEI